MPVQSGGPQPSDLDHALERLNSDESMQLARLARDEDIGDWVEEPADVVVSGDMRVAGDVVVEGTVSGEADSADARGRNG